MIHYPELELSADFRYGECFTNLLGETIGDLYVTGHCFNGTGSRIDHSECADPSRLR